MLLLINSNIISGIFSALEVLLLLFATNLIFRVAHNHNLRTLYQLRRPLCIYPPFLSFCFPSPLTSSLLSRFLTFVFALSLSILTSASFSIVGESKTFYRPQEVPYLVTTAKDDFIDYRLHITPDASLCSLTFRLCYEASCVSSLTNHIITYEKFIDLPGDIDAVKWPSKSIVVNNHTCLTPDSGFKPRKMGPGTEEDMEVSRLAMQCRPSKFNFTRISAGFTGEVNVSSYLDIIPPDCEGKITSLYCSTQYHKACIFLVKIDTYFTLLAVQRRRSMTGLKFTSTGYILKLPPPLSFLFFCRLHFGHLRVRRRL